MPTPMQSTQFPDALDPRFQAIAHEEYDQLPDMIPTLFDVVPHNGREDMRWSEVGALGDWDEFDGNVNYDSMNEGYDTVMTFVEFTKGVQVRRKLYDDDLYHIFDQKPVEMATAASRTRQKHAVRPFSMAFSNDPMFYVRQEGVPICSASHTTTAPGVSTATGFSNLGTASLSAVAVFSARNTMRGFRDDRANRMSLIADELWVPPQLEEIAFEINESEKKLDTANNNANFMRSKHTTHVWDYMDNDPKNWFLSNQRARKRAVKWCDRIAIEYAMIEDFDTLVGKWRGYGRWAMAVLNWRWVFGSQPA